VSLGIAEVDQDAVAHVLCNEAAKPADARRDVSTGRGIWPLVGTQFSPLGGTAISRFGDQRLRFLAVDRGA
jgi:hypothetical protein